jgi:adenylate cyclase
LDSALEALCDAELIREVSRAQVPVTPSGSHDRVYRFSHAIVQEVVYQNMLMKQREVLHGRVGEVLCAASGESPNRLEEVEALAHHFSLSDNRPRAIRYLIDAGDWARRLYANDDALRHYRRAFALVEACATTEADRFRVLERLADLLAIVGQRDEALQHYQALIHLVASSDATGKARLHRKIASLYWEAGARDRAHAELQSALGLLRPHDHSVERAFLCHEMGRLAFRSGDHHRAVEWAERAIAAALPFREGGSQISDEAGPKLNASLNASAAAVVAEANNTLGVTHARIGQIDDAIAHVERSLQMAEAYGFDQAICRACANLGILYGNRDPERAIKLSQRGLEIAKRIGHLGLQSTLYTNLGVAFCTFHVRCDREGVEAVKKSIELDRRLNLVDHLPMPLIALGQLYQCHGQPRLAIGYYREALGLAEALDEPQVLFQCYDGLAAALLDVDDLASARDYLRKAQALCQRTGIDPASLLAMPFLC